MLRFFFLGETEVMPNIWETVDTSDDVLEIY